MKKQARAFFSAIQKLEVKPGDAVFIKVPGDEDAKLAMRMLARVEGKLPVGALFLVVPQEWTLVNLKEAVIDAVAEQVAKEQPAKSGLILPGRF